MASPVPKLSPAETVQQATQAVLQSLVQTIGENTPGSAADFAAGKKTDLAGALERFETACDRLILREAADAARQYQYQKQVLHQSDVELSKQLQSELAAWSCSGS